MATKDIPPFTLSDQSDLPLWVQLRDRMAYLINSGFYQPGEKLPTVRKYAADLHIAYNTVSKAYVDLEHSGYVESVRGRGVFVLDRGGRVEDDVVSAADAEIESCIRCCLSLGMSLDEVKLRMMDVAHRVQEASDPKHSMRRDLQERTKD